MKCTQATYFFGESGMDGKVDHNPDGTYTWYINYFGDANSGCEDTHECHDVTWNAYCEAAEIINKHGYQIIDSYSEHDFVSATFKKVDTNPIPHDERCKYCNGTGRWRDQ